MAYQTTIDMKEDGTKIPNTFLEDLGLKSGDKLEIEVVNEDKLVVTAIRKCTSLEVLSPQSGKTVLKIVKNSVVSKSRSVFDQVENN